jgi:intron-binding protein aquarius
MAVLVTSYLLRQEHRATDMCVKASYARARAGRVNAMLQRRLDLLEQVATLATQLGVPDDAGYTCETAGYFYLLHVLGRWERFCAAVAKAPADDLGAVARLFPFTDFFAKAPPPLFAETSRSEDMEAARVCWRHLQTMFTELEVRLP